MIEQTKLFFRDLRDDESGATAIEYGLIASLISLAMVPVLTSPDGIANFVLRTFTCTKGVFVLGGEAMEKLGSCRDLQGR